MTDLILQPGKSREGSLLAVTRFLKMLPDKKGYQIEIKELRHSRSSQQNRYLNGVAYALLAEATGYTRNDISEYLCGEYFGWKTEKCPRTPHNPGGSKDVPVRTTTRGEDGRRNVLTWDEFYEYTSWVQSFGAQVGVYIPDPDPQWKDRAA